MHSPTCCCSKCTDAKNRRAVHNELNKRLKDRLRRIDQKLGRSKYHESPSIRGIRQAYPHVPTGFSAIRPHLNSDFIGGSAQGYDTEDPEYIESLHKKVKIKFSDQADVRDIHGHMAAQGSIESKPKINLPPKSLVHTDVQEHVLNQAMGEVSPTDTTPQSHIPLVPPNDIIKSTKPPRPTVKTISSNPRSPIDYFVDLETTNIRTTYKSRYQTPGQPTDPIGIIEFATFRRSRANPMKIIPLESATGFTNIINRQLLHRFGVHSHKDIPRSFTEALVSEELGGPGSKFGEQLLAPGNTLFTVLQNTVEAATTGIVPGTKNRRAKFKGTTEYIEGLVRAWERDISQNKQVRFHAWNAGFDFSRIVENVLTLGSEPLKKRFMDIVGRPDHFDIVDLSDPVKQAFIDRMFRDKRYAPMFMNMREIESAFISGVQEHEILQSIKSGETKYIKRNDALRSFFDDVMVYRERSTNKRGVFVKRFEQALKNKNVKLNISRAEQRKTINVLADKLSMVAEATPGQELQAFRRSVQTLRSHSLAGYIEQFVSGAYSPGEGKISLFGSSVERVGPKPEITSGLMTGLDLVSGWSLDVWDRLNQIGKHTGSKAHLAFYDVPASKDASQRVELLNELARGHHPASALHPSEFRSVSFVRQNDRNKFELLSDWLEQGAQNPQEYTTIQQRAQAEIEGRIKQAQISQASRRLKALKRSPEPTGPITKEAKEAIGRAADIGKKALKTPKGNLWLKGAAIGAGIYLLSDWNRENTVEGLRRPEGQADQISGISPEGDTLYGDFGSGRDALHQYIQSLNYPYQISASMLGYRGDTLRRMLLGEPTPGLREVAYRGTATHNAIEHIMLSDGYATAAEQTVYDPNLNIKGRIDLTLPSGTPLELKTVEDYDALMALKAPKDHHISQANFYAFATQKPYALIGYAARNNPDQIKYFKVRSDLHRLLEDAAAVHATQEQLIDEGRLNRLSLSVQNVSSALRTFRSQMLDSTWFTPWSWPGMISDVGHNAIKSLGDYAQNRVPTTYRMEKPQTNTSKCTGGAKIRDHGSRCFVNMPVAQNKTSMNLSRSLNHGAA